MQAHTEQEMHGSRWVENILNFWGTADIPSCIESGQCLRIHLQTQLTSRCPRKLCSLAPSCDPAADEKRFFNYPVRNRKRIFRLAPKYETFASNHENRTEPQNTVRLPPFGMRNCIEIGFLLVAIAFHAIQARSSSNVEPTQTDETTAVQNAFYHEAEGVKVWCHAYIPIHTKKNARLTCKIAVCQHRRIREGSPRIQCRRESPFL